MNTSPPNPAFQLGPSTLAQWVAAFATSAAVLYALYRDNIASYFRRPELTARIEQNPPDCLVAPVPVGNWIGESYWLRLWIQNDGRDAAKHVQVFVARLYQKAKAGGNFISVPDFSPMNLRWSSTDWKNP